jgi:ABC-type taurine transport system ATPase subunit
LSTLEFRAVWSPALANISALFGPGLHVILGQAADGADDLVALCAGVLLPRRGQVLLDGQAPSASPSLRKGIASLLPLEAPGGTGSVRAWLTEVGHMHGFDARGSHADFAPDLGLDQPVASLSNAERRRLALSVALGQPEPSLLALNDPLAAARGPTSDAALQRILELGRQAIVVVTTPSLLDARRLGGELHVLGRGALTRRTDQGWPSAVTPGLDVWLEVDCDSARELLAELCKSPDVEEALYDGRRAPRRVQVRGSDLERLATAVNRAAVSAGVELQLLQVAATDLDSVRGARAGLAKTAQRGGQDARRLGVDTPDRSAGSTRGAGSADTSKAAP